jgi:hypothetical protein
MPESKELASLALRFGMIAGEASACLVPNTPSLFDVTYSFRSML